MPRSAAHGGSADRRSSAAAAACRSRWPMRRRGAAAVWCCSRCAAAPMPARVDAYPHHWVGFGQVGRLLPPRPAGGLPRCGLHRIVVRPALWQICAWISATLRCCRGSSRMFRGGDDHLMSGITKVFEERGFRLVGAHEVAPEILMPEGAVGRFQPSESDHRRHRARPRAAARHRAASMWVRRTIVADGHVLAVEAAEGTDEMLAQVAELRRKGPHSLHRRRAGQGPEARPGSPDRSAHDRAADHRRRGPRRARRHRGRGRRGHHGGARPRWRRRRIARGSSSSGCGRSRRAMTAGQ